MRNLSAPGFVVSLALGLVFAVASGPLAREASAQQVSARDGVSPHGAQGKRRPQVRIYRQRDERGVYPRYNPGPNAVRACSAHLVQEFRPSGTVIVPRMNCFWRG